MERTSDLCSVTRHNKARVHKLTLTATYLKFLTVKPSIGHLNTVKSVLKFKISMKIIKEISKILQLWRDIKLETILED
jgi:hypothetical protein